MIDPDKLIGEGFDIVLDFTDVKIPDESMTDEERGYWTGYRDGAMFGAEQGINSLIAADFGFGEQ